MPQTELPRPLILLGAATLLAFGAAPSLGAQAGSVAPVENGASRVAITLTGDNGGTCVSDYTTAKAGPITFSVTNKTATGLTEVELMSDNRILGEKENLAPGLPTASFTVTLGGGNYQIYCPGAAEETVAFKVTGEVARASTSTAATLLAAGTRDYANYVDGVIEAMQTAVGRLKVAIDAGDLEQARADYALARPFYERIESDVEGFVMPGFKPTDNAGNLDYLIDMRASNLDPAVGWHGFHAIERDLFGNNRITDETKAQAAELAKNVAMLEKVAEGLSYKPEVLGNGAAALLEEVQSGKISGEEEAFSHFDLVDFAGNIEGAQQAFAFLKPGLEKIDPDLTKRVADQFAKVNALLDTYRDSSIPGGYQLYTPALRASAGPALSRAVQALQEPLSQIAEKVATAG
jgi:iron uptake system component EfeO